MYNRDCYLIIGVSDTDEIVGISEENRRKEENYESFN